MVLFFGNIEAEPHFNDAVDKEGNIHFLDGI
jgi:hypothetical protein